MFKSTIITYRDKPIRYELDTISQSDFQLEEQIKFKKNKEFLYSNCNIIKRRFYHYRDANKHPRITICILRTLSGIYSRGISICSFLDQPVKSYGRDKAEDRAIKALKDCKTSAYISRDEACALIMKFPEFWSEIDPNNIQEIFKSAYNIQPSKFELSLFSPSEHTK